MEAALFSILEDLGKTMFVNEGRSREREGSASHL